MVWKDFFKFILISDKCHVTKCFTNAFCWIYMQKLNQLITALMSKLLNPHDVPSNKLESYLS